MRKAFFIYLCINLFSCQKNVSFNEIEKSFLDFYNIGDTLIFESDKGDIDTVMILDKMIRYANWNPIARDSKYKYLSGNIFYGSNKYLFEGKPYPYKLLTFAKDHPDTTYFSISLKNLLIMKYFSKSDYNSFDKYKVNDSTYLFQTKKKAGETIRMESVYWDKKQGIVQYIASDSTVWKKINIK